MEDRSGTVPMRVDSAAPTTAISPGRIIVGTSGRSAAGSNASTLISSNGTNVARSGMSSTSASGVCSQPTTVLRSIGPSARETKATDIGPSAFHNFEGRWWMT